jgi:hypothetical protein
LLVSVPFNLRGGVGSPHQALAIKYPGRRPLARRLQKQPGVIHIQNSAFVPSQRI